MGVCVGGRGSGRLDGLGDAPGEACQVATSSNQLTATTPFASLALARIPGNSRWPMNHVLCISYHGDWWLGSCADAARLGQGAGVFLWQAKNGQTELHQEVR
jgi:hypothetical protein